MSDKFKAWEWFKAGWTLHAAETLSPLRLTKAEKDFKHWYKEYKKKSRQ